MPPDLIAVLIVILLVYQFESRYVLPYRLTDTAVRAVSFWVVPASMRRYLPLRDVITTRTLACSTVGVLPRSVATRGQGSTVSRGSSPSP